MILFVVLGRRHEVLSSRLVEVEGRLIFFFIRVVCPTVPREGGGLVITTLAGSKGDDSSMLVPRKVLFSRLSISIVFNRCEAVTRPRVTIANDV